MHHLRAQWRHDVGNLATTTPSGSEEEAQMRAAWEAKAAKRHRGWYAEFVRKEFLPTGSLMIYSDGIRSIGGHQNTRPSRG
ncbi:hypothetical protein PIB30_031290 [Stylosanthes scabra]|uniref:Uncharacterized protein n=1 Tax=Stylosanthes scabra TaxID=79078 RepID=A0ABU6Z8P2_9FABA|nr:hypothetical protein [Stylosanthes scabra]